MGFTEPGSKPYLRRSEIPQAILCLEKWFAAVEDSFDRTKAHYVSETNYVQLKMVATGKTGKRM